MNNLLGFTRQLGDRIIRICKKKDWDLCDVNEFNGQEFPRAYYSASFALAKQLSPKKDYVFVPGFYIPTRLPKPPFPKVRRSSEGSEVPREDPTVLANQHIREHGVLLPSVTLDKRFVREIIPTHGRLKMRDLPEQIDVPINLLSLGQDEVIIFSNLPRSRYVQGNVRAAFSMSYHAFDFHLGYIEDSLTTLRRTDEAQAQVNYFVQKTLERS